MPARLQRSRVKGSRLPSSAIVVTRPTKWGNPHPLTLGRGEAVRLYEEDLRAGRLAITIEEVTLELRGHDLACYCPLDEPCHADVLLAIANPIVRRTLGGASRTSAVGCDFGDDSRDHLSLRPRRVDVADCPAGLDGGST